MLRKVLLLDRASQMLEEMNQLMGRQQLTWDLVHATDAVSAWQNFESGPVDVIITRSCGLNDNVTDFWSQLIQKSPQTVRITITSSGMDAGRAAESLQYTHQCQPENVYAGSLIKLIDYIVYLQNHMGNLRLEAEIGGLKSLQALPENYIGIIKELQTPEPSVKRISILIQQDMAMTARILQLVNSAFFSLPNRVSKVEQAVSLLGISTIRSMLVSMQLFNVFEGGPVPKRHVEQVWEHSVKVAGLAREIAAREKLADDDLETVLLAGMLHDLGKLILFKLPEYREALTRQKRAGIDNEYALEKEIFGATHAEAGGYLIGIWGINATVSDIVTHHHQPLKSQLPLEFGPLTAIHAADYIIHNRVRSGKAVKPDIDMPYIEKLGLQDRLEQWSQIGS